MKHLSLILLAALISAEAFTQVRVCPSVINLTQMQVQNPARYQRFMNLETFTTNYIANQNNPNQRLINPNGIITIPVVVHVLHRGEAIGTGRNISLAQIQSQIDVLNEDYRRLNADRTNTPAAFTSVASDYGFEFRLACQDPNGNSTNGVLRRQTNKNTFQYIALPNSNGTPDETAMGIKMTSISGEDPWPTDRYLNIWVADFDDNTLGYSTFPADFATNPNVDGVVIETTSMGRTGNVTAPFDRGRTATHEIGHWLNLRHIWGDAVCGDDFVGDTPPQHNQNYHCPGFPHTSACAGNGVNGDMFMNYMDYTDDACMNIYTNGQRLRGRAIFATGGPRAAFIDNYFRIQQPTSTISCSGNISLTNPNCLPATWSITSGPATISSGQGTNTIQVQASGSGTVHLVATAGNYTSEIDFNVSYVSLQPGPINFILIDPYLGKIQAEVDPVPGATSYNWYKNGVSVIPDGHGSFIQFSIPRGVCDVEYDIAVEAVNGCGISPRSHGNAYVPPCDFAFSISPNPASNSINVSPDANSSQLSTNNTIDEIRIYDIQGTLKKYQKFNKAVSATINTQGLNNGSYFIEITSGTYQEKHQLIIQQ